MSTRSYSSDLRGRVIRCVEGGLSTRAAAERFDVSVSSVIRWMRRYRDSGVAEAKPRGGYKASPLDAHKEWLLELIGQEPDITLEEIRRKLPERKISAGIGSIWRFYDRHDISFKKNRSRGRTGPGRRGGGQGRVEEEPGAS